MLRKLAGKGRRRSENKRGSWKEGRMPVVISLALVWERAIFFRTRMLSPASRPFALATRCCRFPKCWRRARAHARPEKLARSHSALAIGAIISRIFGILDTHRWIRTLALDLAHIWKLSRLQADLKMCQKLCYKTIGFLFFRFINFAGSLTIYVVHTIPFL